MYLFLLAIFLVSVFLAIATHVGFPYRDDSDGYPTVQRHYITHTQRNFYDSAGKLRYADSGYWLRDLDRNALKTVEGIAMPNLPLDQLENNMCKEVFCGLPVTSARQLHTGWDFWNFHILKLSLNLQFFAVATGCLDRSPLSEKLRL